MTYSKGQKRDKIQFREVFDQNIKHGNQKKISEKNDKKQVRKSKYKPYIVFILAFCCGLAHRFHVSTLFENDRHFSHLSTLEREMTFRSEMGLYYSYYKTIVEADSFTEGFDQLVFNNLTEYPSVINTFERFNLFPEVLIGGLFRAFERLCIWFNLSGSECWQVERGHGMPPVLSCEGYRQPEYFYLEAVWCAAFLTGFSLFLYGFLLSDSIIGGLITVISFFFNHGECSRVQWTPPLRESFAYPFCLILMLTVTNIIKSTDNTHHASPSIIAHKFRLAFLSFITCMCLMMWQFSQFLIATQLLSLLAMFAVGFISKFSLYFILLGEFFGVLHAALLLFGNEMLISSLMFSLLISSIISLKIFYPMLISNFSLRRSSIFSTFIILLMSGALNKWVLVTDDDAHIKNILFSKLTDYKDFHTLLYTCSVEYDFLGWEPIKKLSHTWLLPIVILILCLLAFHFFSSSNKLSAVDAGIVYNVVQLAAFTIMAVFIMRLKLFFTPHLCIMSSLLVPNKYFKLLKKELHYALIILIIGGMSYYGINNLKEQYSIYGEYSNYGLEELLTWISSSTDEKAVFAGTMPLTAAILLSTRRPIVNHPHYEDASLRERTKKVYSVYSRKPPEEIYKMISSLHVNYIVISENWCFNNNRGTGCRHVDLWDTEDTINKNRSPTCPNIYVGAIPHFQRVFSNSEYAVLKLTSPKIKIDKSNKIISST